MPRKKLTEKQKELLSLTTRVDAELTPQQRILLGCIVEMCRERSNFVEENGYVHASVSTLKKECGLGQDTIKSSITKLVNEGLITCEVGKVGVQNTRFSLTEKTKKYIYTYSVPMNVPIGEKVYYDQTKKIESLELRINELVEDKKKLTEEVEKLKKYIGIGVGIEQSCNSSCNHLSNINNSSQNTIPERSCTGDVDEKVFQIENEEKGTGSEYHQPEKKPYNFNPKYFDSTPEPVKRKKSTGVVSSSLQIIEEENHPDTRTDADGVTIPSNESISNRTEQPDEAEKSSSKKGQSETDRFTSSQLLDCAFSTCSAAPRTLEEQYEDVLSDISRWVDLTVEEQISKEDENKKLLNEASRRRGFDIVAEVHELMRPKAIELGELYTDYYDTYKNLNGFVSLGKFIKDAERRVLLHLRELHGQKAHVKRYPELKNGSIILREAS